MRKIFVITVLALVTMGVHAQNVVQDMNKFLKQEYIELTHGNDAELFMHGRDKFEDMFDAVRHAQRFIHMEYFNFRNDSVANELFDLLAEKVAEGVEVRCMYDDFGNWSNNSPINKEQHANIRARGIDLVKFDPLKFPWVNHIIPRDHRKIVVIDGRIAYTGGMNVADYYVNGLEGIGPWRDLHMHLEGPVVNKLHEIFVTMWREETGETLEGERYFPEQEQNGNMDMAVIDRHPRRTNASIRKLYVKMLDGARHEVRLVNPYFVPTHKVRKALKNAIDRGIDVQIMLSDKSDIPLTPDASHYVGRRLQKRGAKVYMFQGGFHHSKVMTVDKAVCTIGSANLDSRSLRCDYEVNTLILHRKPTAELNSMFEEDKTQSVPMDDTYWKKKSVWKRFVAWFGNLLTPFL